MGAACSGAGLSGITVQDVEASNVTSAEAVAGLGKEVVAALAAKEQAMAAQAEVKAAMEKRRSEYEAYIFQMRNSMDTGKHKDKLDRATIGPLLEKAEDWLYSDVRVSLALLFSGSGAVVRYAPRPTTKMPTYCAGGLRCNAGRSQRTAEHTSGDHPGTVGRVPCGD